MFYLKDDMTTLILKLNHSDVHLPFESMVSSVDYPLSNSTSLKKFSVVVLLLLPLDIYV